jgi:hypothetical protein
MEILDSGFRWQIIISWGHSNVIDQFGVEYNIISHVQAGSRAPITRALGGDNISTLWDGIEI